ncbi:hypothetical protein PSQ39_06450 [Curvibacter sp. HBC28]|uniref:Cro/Cl family transcriptional regulator n=1 Tax=Curvibacter microcysteis TaxID=3026419 RepID=A0ABT5MCV9_9BURK|nr:hypothetical protein [Curvibacter sp. HBC28]MDD0814266.1 hypothetical protein [Curvibacter sp. HBC28]
MKKIEAIELLGGTMADAARAIGISHQSVQKWPDVLSNRIRDRVHAVLYRQSVAAKAAPSRKKAK